MSKKVLIETWGCQMNTADSERMLALLATRGYELTQDESAADLVLLNTCHIREKARHKVVSRLGVLREIKDKKPGLTIAVAGCVAQAEGARLMKAAPVIDVLLGPGKIDDLPRLLDEREKSGKASMAVGFKRHEPAHEHEHERAVPAAGDLPLAAPTLSGKNDVSRYVNIQQGCNNYCTFCVVPFTRGREVSRRIAEIEAECRALVDGGAREITLLGQNVNSYGSDLADSVSGDGPFVELLSRVAKIPGLTRLRFTTSNPHDFTKALADLFRHEPKLGRYLHLPVQSGNDRTLERMKRKVTVAEYWERISWLRAAVPDMALSTDLIVGFPGETDAEFEDTLKLVEAARYSFAFTFKYSPRKNTPAARYVDQVPEEVKEERLARLNALQDRLTLEHYLAEIGQKRDVLFHYESKKHPGQYYGRTDHFRLVRVESARPLVGECLPVEIFDANKTAALGRLV